MLGFVDDGFIDWIDPIELGLRTVVELRATLERVERLLVAEARSKGASWTDVGQALGIARQSAHRRHRAPARATAHPTSGRDTYAALTERMRRAGYLRR